MCHGRMSAGEGQHCQDEGQHEHGRLRVEHQPLARHAVCNGTRIEHEQPDREAGWRTQRSRGRRTTWSAGRQGTPALSSASRSQRGKRAVRRTICGSCGYRMAANVSRRLIRRSGDMCPAYQTLHGRTLVQLLINHSSDLTYQGSCATHENTMSLAQTATGGSDAGLTRAFLAILRTARHVRRHDGRPLAHE